MGIDIDTSSPFEGSLRAWVKCARCSARLGRPYPVEAMGLEPVAERSRLLGRCYTMIVPVRCHDQEMRCAIEVPMHWGEGMRMQALAYVYAFVPGPGGKWTCEVRRGTRGQSAGMLTTEVR
ncbi:MAG TPA: hypothetical protein VMI75_17275 [Polyangiaceae bacterium]|nr:hypothetical protein [Polyangiaceae bacterium]